ncbi:SURF1 family cytochrome oxidase biogenesis protein [Streptomyces varsoviensis]|uniref:SURF1 family cytochrome oxidase biogenesis protein n=1 Tax=Streptomyces varsoviensis TaxID=67373 RepID=UPI0004C66EF5|nr:SURF1 family protein [Streptomyces varsoviensis]
MYRFLLSRQWVILTLVGLVLIPVMIKLGFWQFHRHEHKVAQNQLIADSLAAEPVPVGKLTAPGRPVPHDDMWRRVTAQGTYDTKDEVVVRQRTSADGRSQGYYVLTPLLLDDGRAVLVNRGWIPADGNLTEFPKVPAAPAGKVSVLGRLKEDETSGYSGIKDKKGLPPRQVMLINSGEQAKNVHRPLLSGYIELISPHAKGQPELVPAPDHSEIGPHMAYAIQWWLFTAAVPVGWVILVRRERRDRLASAAKAAAEAKEAGAGPEPKEAGASAKDARTDTPGRPEGGEIARTAAAAE